MKYRLSSDNNNQSLLQLLFRVEFRLKTLYLFDSKYSINLLLNQNNTNLPSPNSALNVLSNISPTPEPSLEATLKFDPNISKFLPNNAPIPPIDEKLLNVQGALPYKQFEPILKALQNLHDSTNIQDPLEWLNFVSFRSILTNNDIQTPAYVRNLTLILFISDNNLIFHKYPIDWIPDGIFESMIGLPSGLINLIYELKSFGSPLSTTSIDAFEIWIQRFSGVGLFFLKKLLFSSNNVILSFMLIYSLLIVTIDPVKNVIYLNVLSSLKIYIMKLILSLKMLQLPYQ